MDNETRTWKVIINVPTYYFYCVDAKNMDEAEKKAWAAHNGMTGGSPSFVGDAEMPSSAVIVTKVYDRAEVEKEWEKALDSF